ncbi:Cytochrome P450 4C1, partial [Blattella germanica]
FKNNLEFIFLSITLGRKKRLAFLDLLIENSETEMKLTDEEIREEVDTFMFEGHDTTSAAVGWGLQLLAMHPEIQRVIKSSKTSAQTEDLDLAYMVGVYLPGKGLRRAVQPLSGLRGRSVDARLERHEVLGESHQGDPEVISQLALTPYYTHRMEEHYPNPEVFDPDRFLPENVAKRHPYAYIPFSAGPRNCIGQKFAMLEMKSMFSSIIRHYKLETTREMPVVMPELIIRPENGVHLKITKRLPAA